MLGVIRGDFTYTTDPCYLLSANTHSKYTLLPFWNPWSQDFSKSYRASHLTRLSGVSEGVGEEEIRGVSERDPGRKGGRGSSEESAGGGGGWGFEGAGRCGRRRKWEGGDTIYCRGACSSRNLAHSGESLHPDFVHRRKQLKVQKQKRISKE